VSARVGGRWPRRGARLRSGAAPGPAPGWSSPAARSRARTCACKTAKGAGPTIGSAPRDTGVLARQGVGGVPSPFVAVVEFISHQTCLKKTQVYDLLRALELEREIFRVTGIPDERPQPTILIEALAAPDPVQLALRAIEEGWTAEQAWANAEALASYAKQAQDDGLRTMADRIPGAGHSAVRGVAASDQAARPGRETTEGKRWERPYRFSGSGGPRCRSIEGSAGDRYSRRPHSRGTVRGSVALSRQDVSTGAGEGRRGALDLPPLRPTVHRGAWASAPDPVGAGGVLCAVRGPAGRLLPRRTDEVGE
jgi:hypothetical protein